MRSSRRRCVPRRERLPVVGVEAVGPYTLLRLARGALDPGGPGQFFMLEAPGRVLPRRALALPRAARRARVPDRPGRPGDAGARRARAGRRDRRLRPARATASASTSAGRCSSAAGSAIAPLPYLSEALERPPAVLGFRSAHHAEAAELVPNAEVVIDPVLVTDALPARPRRARVRPRADARGASARSSRTAQLAWEAPMACGYGACYGCVVEVDGELARLCVEGPVLCSS